ncbi:MAG: sugar phosphate isomerase/epimerase [Verrucomicrobiae bacterium]|nr:sugar phosphate isomerase/epimerase [Verrucomicrobiae bacterium]
MISRRQFLTVASATAAGVLSRRLASAEKEPSGGLKIGFMIWRIGDILDFDKQVEWVAQAGFESISFHSSAGVPGKWQGIEPATADANQRRRIKRLLSRFVGYEIHAPFDAVLRTETPEPVLRRLGEVPAVAGAVGASIVTVHVEAPRKGSSDTLWQKALDRLDAAATQAGVRIGLEFNSGFEWLRQPRRPRIGATLDIGHMYHRDGAGYRPYGTIGALVKFLDEVLFHLHVHDYDGKDDHIEVGTGRIDFDDVLRNLNAIGYRGALCLELNPDRCPPDGIRRSAAFLRARANEVKRTS